jgi:hypothetical protein
MNKKKKRQKAEAGQSTPVSTTTEPEPVQAKKEKSSAEILEEMFGMKIQLPEPQEVEAPPSYGEKFEDEPETWDPTKEYEQAEKKTKKIEYESKVKAKKTELSASSEKHRAFKDEIEPEQVLKSLGVKKLFSQQTNLKDYIKVQEILNKPKALRR